MALALSLAILMPVIAAYLYRTYMHEMVPGWVEGSRLYEVPFLLFALTTIIFAFGRAFTIRGAWMELPKDARVAAAVLVGAVFVSSIVYSRNPSLSVATSAGLMLNLVFAAAVVHLLRQSDRGQWGYVMPVFTAGILVLAVYTAWRFSFPPPASEVRGGVIEWSAAVPGFISVRHFGSWTGAIAAGLAVRILYMKDAPGFRWSHLCYLIAASATVWSGTRGAILAMIVTAGIVTAGLRRLPPARAIGRAALLTGLSLAIAYPLLPDAQAFHLIASRDYGTIATATSDRASLWELTFLRWLDSPLFGWGTSATLWEVDSGEPHVQPHNAILQFLISWGLVGTGAALYLLGRAIRQVHRVGLGDDTLRPLLGMLYALLLQSLIEGMLHYPRFIQAIFFLFAILIVARRSGSAGAVGQAG
ncbi:O-antigen ligase family protein [Qipengyuania sediminis]|uniref:O-antigen ligase family protein n=1 Tax=Qipengyuania sediminis TaxID=1532023 RepID=UPI001404DE8A|nr:O-antigen ligase family protein [Qipengyuania sediminis]